MLSESIAEFLREFTGSDYLTLFLLSAIPLTELRGALIIMGGMSGVNRVLGFLCCVAGSAVIVPPVILLVRPLIHGLKSTRRLKSMGGRLESGIASRAEAVQKTAKRAEHSGGGLWGKLLGLFGFVALPLPMTGAWTGAAIGGMMNLPVVGASLAVIFGNFAAGGILLLILAFVPREYTDLLLIGFALLALALFLSGFLVRLRGRARKKTKE